MKSLITAFALVLSLSVGAQTPQPPEIAARSYLLMDITTGQVLAEKDADASVEPASLTKLMSAYIVFDALRSKKVTLTQTLPVSVRAWKMEGSRMFIDPKMSVRVEDLLKGLIVQSGNDAAVALAEGVGGSVERFVAMMNERAKQLGMTHTSYQNPEGLTIAGHTTTAQDLSILALRLMSDFPQYISYYAIPKFRLEGSPKSNDTNRNTLLLRDPSKMGFTVDGLKTGHTQAAGFCYVVTARRPDPRVGERRLLAILLGTPSEAARAKEGEKLLTWGYGAFELVKLFDPKAVVGTSRIWRGSQSQVKLGLSSGQVTAVAVPTGTNTAQLTTQLVVNDKLLAPIQAGQPAATLQVFLNNQKWHAIPLQSLEDVAVAGWMGRAFDSVLMLFQ